MVKALTNFQKIFDVFLISYRVLTKSVATDTTPNLPYVKQKSEIILLKNTLAHHGNINLYLYRITCIICHIKYYRQLTESAK